MAHFGCLSGQKHPWATHVPGRAARSDQPKSLLYLHITRVFNAGTVLEVDQVAILHETLGNSAHALTKKRAWTPENLTTTEGAVYLNADSPVKFVLMILCGSSF